MNWRASLKAAAVGTMSGTAIGLIAFSFLTSHQHPSMGAVLFLLVPVAAGFSIVLVARTPNSAVAAVISIVFSSFARRSGKRRSAVCASGVSDHCCRTGYRRRDWNIGS
jgi:drug/metabolite transporter (DMT)-like permease